MEVEAKKNVTPNEELEKSIEALLDKCFNEDSKIAKGNGSEFDNISSDEDAKKERPTQASGGQDVIKDASSGESKMCPHNLLPEICKECSSKKEPEKKAEDENVEKKDEKKEDKKEEEKKSENPDEKKEEKLEKPEEKKEEEKKSEESDEEKKKKLEEEKKSKSFEITEDEFQLIKANRQQKSEALSKAEQKAKEEEFKKSVMSAVKDEFDKLVSKIDSLEKALSKPVGPRKSLSGTEIIDKSFVGNQGAEGSELTKSQKLDLLEKAVYDGKIKSNSVMEFESCGDIHDPLEKAKAELIFKNKK